MKRIPMLSLALLIISISAPASLSQQPPSQPAPPEPPAPAIAYATGLFDGNNFLGIYPEEITRENMAGYGLTGELRGVGVRSVVKGGPAERAGLREKDVILRFDGEEVTSTRKLNRLIAEAAPEHRVRLTILRGGAQQEINATLGRQEFASGFSRFGEVYDAEAARRMAEELRRNSEALGLKGEELSKRLEELQRANPGGFALVGVNSRRIGVSATRLGRQLADYFGVTDGVLVESVEAGSPAERAGLKAGDVITQADGDSITSTSELTRAVNRRQEGEVMLTVVRDRRTRSVRVTPEKREPTLVQPGEFRLIAPRAGRAPVVTAPARPPHAPPAPARTWTWSGRRAI